MQLSKTMRLLCFLLAVLVGAATMSSCASRPKPTRQVRIAVLNGTTNYEVAPEGEVRHSGWWFGAKDQYLSSNVGIQLGHALDDRLGRIPGVETYSRDDMMIYFAQKERLLLRNYPDLSELQRKQLLQSQSPNDYGKSLRVDYVVSSSVDESWMKINRTFSWWFSHLNVKVQLWDISSDSDTPVKEWTWEDTDHWDSQLALVEECAKEIARDAEKKDVFRLFSP